MTGRGLRAVEPCGERTPDEETARVRWKRDEDIPTGVCLAAAEALL
ncbi:MAG TPA: hypothetical protein VMM35_06200 [Longimicrobiales bacterium]|nr:hypothetical protein [Longimicrobiales bacterium]